MDGHRVADIVSEHQADSFGAGKGQDYDPTLNAPHVGLNFAQ
jgi:hypothetical protein